MSCRDVEQKMVAQVLDAPATIQAVIELLQKVKQSALLFNCLEFVHRFSLSPSPSVCAHTHNTHARMPVCTQVHVYMHICGHVAI